MALPARFSLLHSDLNDFLFAPVGADDNGMPLSVLSALTRLGVDPWEEAARLAALPKARAAAALAGLITQLSVERLSPSVTLETSSRLVERLPMQPRRATPDRGPPRAIADKRIPVGVWLACLALGAAVVWGLS